MDVREWLQNTADRAPPDQDQAHALPDYLRPDTEAEHTQRPKYRHKRKRASSDSSILQPRSPARDTRTAKHASASEGARAIVHDASAARYRQGAVSQSSWSRSASRAPEETFGKRRRHKTRPDRYEPKSKKERKSHEPREDRESKSKCRKSRRSGEGERAIGMVNSFQLKTGPKNSRLTLKPNLHAGLFKHGRASEQVTGRGGGLPDLVFNEMNFLRKPKQHHDDPLAPQKQPETKKSRKTRAGNEEISAYFENKKSEARDAPREEVNSTSRQTERPSASKALSMTNAPAPELHLDLPEIPFLGFGSRGPDHNVKDKSTESHSHVSWSESQPQAAGRPDSLIPANARSAEQFAQLEENGDELLRSTSRGSRQLGVDKGTWLPSRRTRGPALVEVFNPQEHVKGNDPRHRRSPTKTTIQSLPRLSSSKQADTPRLAARRLERAKQYRTSDILDLRHAHTPEVDQIQTFDHLHQSLNTEKENRDPKSSSSTTKLLRLLHDVTSNGVKKAVHPKLARRQEITRPDRDASDRHMLHTLREADIDRKYHGKVETAQTIETTRPRAENAQRDPLHPHYYVARRFNQHDRDRDMPQPSQETSTDRQQHQRPHSGNALPAAPLLKRRGLQSANGHQLKDTRTPSYAAVTQPHYGLGSHIAHQSLNYHVLTAEDDDEMLDTGPDYIDSLDVYHYAQPDYYGARDVTAERPAVPRFLPSHNEQTSGVLAHEHADDLYSFGGEPTSGDLVDEHRVPRMDATQSAGLLEDAVPSELVGFWKPNMLY